MSGDRFTSDILLNKGFTQNEKGEWVPGPKPKQVDAAIQHLDDMPIMQRNKVGRPALTLTDAEQKKLLKKFKRGKYPESKLQERCVSWFRSQFPQYYWLFFAIPNGGFRNKVTAKILKVEGAISGIHDLFLSVPSKGFNGLYIEMKIKPNKLTDNQEQFKKAVEAQGYKTAVCYDYEQFQSAINQYLQQ